MNERRSAFVWTKTDTKSINDCYAQLCPSCMSTCVRMTYICSGPPHCFSILLFVTGKAGARAVSQQQAHQAVEGLTRGEL